MGRVPNCTVGKLNLLQSAQTRTEPTQLTEVFGKHDLVGGARDAQLQVASDLVKFHVVDGNAGLESNMGGACSVHYGIAHSVHAITQAQQVGVDALAAVQQVISNAAVQHIIAETSIEQIVAGAALQSVACGTTHQTVVTAQALQGAAGAPAIKVSATADPTTVSTTEV